MLHKCMVRHTKLQVLGGEEVLQLPPKTEVDVPGELPASTLDCHLGVSIPCLLPAKTSTFQSVLATARGVSAATLGP